jgi:hypothetical protein
MIQITLQYFDDCPNWQTTDLHLATFIADGLDAVVGYERIDGYEAALEKGFRGSPTVLINGVDPFPEGQAQPGLACRIYNTEHGPAGSPTLKQLRTVIATAEAGS